MKVAVLSDIHGNIEALDTVLKSAKEAKIEKFILLGDYVGYLYHPKEVIERIMDLDHVAIRGNHEDILYKLETGELNLSDITTKYGSGHEIALRELNTDQKEYIFNLTTACKVELNGKKISLYHESPWNDNRYIYPNSEIPSKLKDESDFIFFGHSHYQFCRRINDKYIYNPGSVGQNREIGGIANWLEIELISEYIKFKWS